MTDRPYSADEIIEAMAEEGCCGGKCKRPDDCFLYEPDLAEMRRIWLAALRLGRVPTEAQKEACACSLFETAAVPSWLFTRMQDARIDEIEDAERGVKLHNAEIDPERIKPFVPGEGE